MNRKPVGVAFMMKRMRYGDHNAVVVLVKLSLDTGIEFKRVSDEEA